jgi:hypothetical protein
MKVSKLIEVLQTVSPDADVELIAKHNPATGKDTDIGSGPPIYIAVTAVDGIDQLVVLCNYVDDKHCNPVFDAPPQFKRFSLASSGGASAAVADLVEQAGSEPTKDLDTHLEVERVKDLFRKLEGLQ